MKNSKRYRTRRLALRAETLRELSRAQLDEVAGAARGEPSECNNNSCSVKFGVTIDPQ